MNRIVPVLLVALLVCLAGCSALSDASPTREPFDVTGTTPLHGIEFDVENDRMPAGDDVYRAHYDSLEDASYTVAYETVTRLNGSVVAHGRWHLQYAAERSRYLQTTHITGRDQNETFVAYANGTHVWRKTTRDNRTSVNLATNGLGEPLDPEPMRAEVARSLLQSVLYDLEDPTVEKQLPSSTASSRYLIATDDLDGPYDENASVSVEMTVTGDGRVTLLRYHVEETHPNGERFVQTTTLRYLHVNATTVERPHWVPEPDENTTQGEPATVTPTTTTGPETATTTTTETGAATTTESTNRSAITTDGTTTGAGNTTTTPRVVASAFSSGSTVRSRERIASVARTVVMHGAR